MRLCLFTAALFVAGMAAGVLAPSHAGTVNGPGGKVLAPLFNGKDLSGWEGDRSLWSVHDGVIIGKHPQNKTTNRYLCTKETFGDFELRISWKLQSPKGNSGVQIRSEPRPNLLVAGFQVEIAAENCGGIFEELGRGWLARPKDAWKDAVKLGDWNRYVITARGDHVTVSVNGVAITDLHDAKGRKSGVIALQHYRGEVRFKDIKLKKL